MPVPKLNKQRAALILAEADLMGEQRTIKRYQITKNTLTNYRKRVTEDKELWDIFVEQKKFLSEKWSEYAVEPLLKGMARLDELLPKSDNIHSITGAVKILGELKIASDAAKLELSDPQNQQFTVVFRDEQSGEIDNPPDPNLEKSSQV